MPHISRYDSVQTCLQRLNVPFVRNSLVEIVIQVEAADGSALIFRILSGNMAFPDFFSISFEKIAELWIVVQRDKSAFIVEQVYASIPTRHCTSPEIISRVITSGSLRSLFNIELVKRSYKALVRVGGYFAAASSSVGNSLLHLHTTSSRSAPLNLAPSNFIKQEKGYWNFKRRFLGI